MEQLREYDRYFFRNETVLTVLYEFDTKEAMMESGLLNDSRRTTCFMSDGKYYVGGHFAEDKNEVR